MGLASSSSLADWNVPFSKGNSIICSQNRNPNFYFTLFFPKRVSCSSLTSMELRVVSWFCSSNRDAIIICAEKGMKVSLKSLKGNGIHITKDQMWTTLSLGLLFPGHSRVNIQFGEKFLEACRSDLRSCRYNSNLDDVVGKVPWISKPQVENWSLVSASLHLQVFMTRGNCFLGSPCPSTLPCSTCQSSSVHSLQHRWIPALVQLWLEQSPGAG